MPPQVGTLISAFCLQEGDDKKQDKPKEPYPFLFPFLKLFELDSKLIDEEPSFYTANFSRDREEQFIVKDRETFFTSAQRSQIAWTILMRTKFDEDQKVPTKVPNVRSLFRLFSNPPARGGVGGSGVPKCRRSNGSGFSSTNLRMLAWTVGLIWSEPVLPRKTLSLVVFSQNVLFHKVLT